MVHFVSPPYTSQRALDKVLELARLLTVYCGRMIVHIIPFTEIQEEIRRQCPEEYFTLIMRRTSSSTGRVAGWRGVKTVQQSS